jgi:protein-tyrosine phosphatase
MKILMVCLGNICRSPLAEGILSAKAKALNLNWEVDSAGTGGWHSGEMPDRRSIEIAKMNGIDITNQRARKVRSTDFEDFDYIFAMDTNNFQDLIKWTLDDAERAKIKLILNEIYPNEERSVPDPYWDDNGFEKVFKMLDAACSKIIEKYS